ncbi:MAG: acyltransferase [Xanthobacteraceae bacterium]|nr:acyltransferase [Xanthobacteraceae bacterium]
MLASCSDNRAHAAQVSGPSKQQLPCLTALRGLAALWVVIYHYSVQCFPNLDVRPHTYLIHKGYLAVDMFFMLSGFVLAHVYHRPFSESVTGRNYWKFIAARIARIYPLHLLVLLLFVATALTSHLMSGEASHVVRDVPLQGPQSVEAFFANLLMLQGLRAGTLSWNYPAWSISVEFMAYLLFPFLLPGIWRTSTRIKLVLAGVLFALLVLLAYLRQGDFDQWDGPITLLRCLPEFMLGTLLYCAFRVAPGNLWLNRDVAAFGVVALIVVGLHLNAADLLMILLFAALILAAVLNNGAFARWANAAPLLWLGDISYSLYLLHGLVQYAAGLLLVRVGVHDATYLSTPRSLVWMLAMVGLCLLAAHFSYSGFEVASRRYLRKLLDMRDKRRAAASIRSGTLHVQP